MRRLTNEQSVLSFYLDAKLHEDFRIRLYYDQVKNQSEFFRMCVESYLAQNNLFMKFFDEEKVARQVQSKARTSKSKLLRDKGKQLMDELALTHDEVQNIFDILEEDLPEL
tara:strand:+ start:6874 stop:7206 length:333 start_codon:yes stop_codon:yes gene_type:complete